jgi:hypothetical protein
MKTLTSWLAATMIVAAFAPAQAAEPIAAAVLRADANAAVVRRAELLRPVAPAAVVAGPKALQANPDRAYPPSCLSDPLPTTPTGPAYGGTLPLPAINQTTGAVTIENTTVSFWRVACSSAGQFYNSATLMRIQRAAGHEGDNANPVLFPDVRIAQTNGANDIDFDDDQLRDYVRLANEPNTIRSDYLPGSLLVSSQTFTLENFAAHPTCTGSCFDFNLSFDVRFFNFVSSGTNLYYMNVPLYDPDGSSYPAINQDQPITGYLSGNWYDPAHSGEGIETAIAEGPVDASGRAQIVVLFTWYTFDDFGLPYWLTGSAVVDPAHPRSVSIPTFYASNGGFAGNFGARIDADRWGTVTFGFPDCNTLEVGYASDPGLPEGVPSGSGSLTYTRLITVNGLTCE